MITSTITAARARLAREGGREREEDNLNIFTQLIRPARAIAEQRRQIFAERYIARRRIITAT